MPPPCPPLSSYQRGLLVCYSGRSPLQFCQFSKFYDFFFYFCYFDWTIGSLKNFQDFSVKKHVCFLKRYGIIVSFISKNTIPVRNKTRTKRLFLCQKSFACHYLIESKKERKEKKKKEKKEKEKEMFFFLLGKMLHTCMEYYNNNNKVSTTVREIVSTIS